MVRVRIYFFKNTNGLNKKTKKNHLGENKSQGSKVLIRAQMV